MNENTESQQGPQPIPTEPMGAALTRLADPQDQSQAGLELFKERARVAKETLKVALSFCQPGQIVVMAAGDKESVYFTGGAADRILRMGFGMRWGEARHFIDLKDGAPDRCTYRAPLFKADGELYETFEGRRTMGGFVHTEADLIKGAKENMKHQAVTDILGTRFLTPGDLAELGLDVRALPRRAEFQDHGKDESGGAVVPWGKMKGKPITELADKDLDYYEGKARESIADPAKAKFKAREEAWLLAIGTERARRLAPKPATDSEQLDALCIQIQEKAAAQGIEQTTITSRLAKITTVADARAALKKLDESASKATTTREPGSEG